MPIPWGAILVNIPWSKVIDNAPKLLDGAQKLINRVKKDPPPSDIEPVTFSDNDDDAEPIARLTTLVQENRRELQTLHQDLQDTASLLHHLTEQNTKMVSEVERLRRRTLRLQRFMAIMALVLAGLLVFSCTRS